MANVNVLTATTPQLRRLFRSRKPSGRKLRLFTVACCRFQHAIITEPACLALIDLAEQAADGEVTDLRLAEMRQDVHQWSRTQGAIIGGEGADAKWIAQWGAYQTATDKPTSPVYGFIKHPAYRPFLADILGPPPKSTTFSPLWRTDTAVSLARSMYESREFSAMPILADALQDAGCDNDNILNHCRDTSLTHVRGCWVVDLVRSKS